MTMILFDEVPPNKNNHEVILLESYYDLTKQEI